jgi:hypothetical protein
MVLRDRFVEDPVTRLARAFDDGGLENIGSAFERGDPDVARAALERAQEAISDGDLDDQ